MNKKICPVTLLAKSMLSILLLYASNTYAALAEDRVIRIDFGHPGLQSGSTSEIWNNLTSPQAIAADDPGMPLVDNLDQATGIYLKVTKSFEGVNTGGSSVNTLGFPASMTKDSFWTGDASGNVAARKKGGQITLSGLEVNAEYKLTLFASREGDDGGLKRLTNYTFDTNRSTRTLDASDNIDEQFVLTGLQPDSRGVVVVDVRVKPNVDKPEEGSRFAYLGGMLIEPDSTDHPENIVREILTTDNADILSSEHDVYVYSDDSQKDEDPLAIRCLDKPSSFASVPVGADIQHIIDTTTEKHIILEEGKHRITSALKPKRGMKIYGTTEKQGNDCILKTRLMGSIPLEPEQVPGEDYYYAPLPEAYQRTIGRSWAYTFDDKCAVDEDDNVLNPRCYYPDDLLIVDKNTGKQLTYLRHMSAGGDALEPNTWFLADGAGFDGKQRFTGIYIRYDDYDPGAMDVEFAFSYEAFTYSGQNGANHGWYKENIWTSNNKENRDVGIFNLIVENFATPIQYGAIGAQGTPAGWRIEGNIVRNNHGAGIYVGPEAVVRYNHIYDNGQLGIVGSRAMHSIVDANTIYGNNRALVSAGFSAGGAKITRSYGLRYTRNCAYRNRGPGLWTDVSTQEVIYQWNVAMENTGSGIFHEISYDAKIAENLVGFNATTGDSGGQIYVSTSDFTVVEKNDVIEQGDVAGAAINVVWNSRGIGDRYNVEEVGPNLYRPLLVDDSNMEYQAIPGDADMWVGRDNIVRNNRVYHQGTDLKNDILMQLIVKDSFASGQYDGFVKSLEDNTQIFNNTYFSNAVDIPTNTTAPTLTPLYLWSINKRKGAVDDATRLSLTELKALKGDENSPVDLEGGSTLNGSSVDNSSDGEQNDHTASKGIRFVLGDPNAEPSYCLEVKKLVPTDNAE